MNEKRNILILILFLPFLVLFACEEDKNMESRVVTEEILFISSDKIRISGRVLTIANDGIQDHGFLVSTDENFTSPIMLSLGEKSIPGRFIGTVEGLELKTNYYIKSFVTTGGIMIFGNTFPFTTLGPFISDFSPRMGFENQVITISGGNFTDKTKVYFGDVEANVSSVEIESLVKVVVPPISNSVSTEIKVVIDTEELIFSIPFEYVIGKWEQTGTFLDNNRYAQNMFFQTADKLIFGLGRAQGPNDKIWELDFNTWTWSEIPFTGTRVNDPFSAGGFFGSGVAFKTVDEFIPSNEFYKYNPLNGDFDLVGILPFGLAKSAASVLNDDLYIFGGLNSDYSENRVIYKYDHVTGIWSNLGTSPVFVSTDYPYFTHNNLTYFVAYDSHLYRFNPANNRWDIISPYPQGIRTGAVAVVLNDKAYIGLVRDDRRLWEYDITANTWKAKSGFTGDARLLNAAWWSYNNKVYIMRSDLFSVTGGGAMKIWSLDPDAF